MKRITFLAMFVAMVLGMNAQSSKTMHIWKDGVATNFLIASEIDSITFSDGNIDKENVNPVKGDYIWPILLDNITFEANASKIVADFRPNDINNFFYIWSTGETYISNSPGTGLNFYGNDEGYLSLTVAAPDGWSGCGFCLEDEECAAAADALRKEIIANPNEYFLHLAIKSTNTGNHQFYTFNNQSTSFAIGTTTIEAGDVIGNFTRDGEWYEFNIPMANFVTALNTIGDFPVEGNILCVLSGGQKGSELNLDAVYFYKKAESENPPIDSEEPEGALPGEFHIGPTKKVSFAKGNLQYLASAGVWRFAENQYDFIGSKNNNASKNYNGWIDVFGYGTSGWSGSGASYYQPWNAHYSNDDLSGYLNKNLSGSYANADWGVFNQISNGGNATNMWRTLSQEEWGYLITNHDWTIVQVAGILGLMILPDNFKNPLTISIDYPSYQSGLYDSDKNYSLSFSSMTKLSTEQFDMLQAAGVVFLPCGGYRYSIGMMDIDTFGNYWTSTAGKNIWFTPDVLYCVSGAERWAGLQVRLATDIE